MSNKSLSKKKHKPVKTVQTNSIATEFSIGEVNIKICFNQTIRKGRPTYLPEKYKRRNPIRES